MPLVVHTSFIMASPSPKDPKLTSSHPRIVDRAVLAALQKPMITNLSVVENAALPSKVTSHITCKQKQDISNRINGLSDAGMDAALEIIREHMPTLKVSQRGCLTLQDTKQILTSS